MDQAASCCVACNYNQDLCCASCTANGCLQRWQTRRRLQTRADELQLCLASALRKKLARFRHSRRVNPPSSSSSSSGDAVVGIVAAARVRTMVDEMRNTVLPALHAKRLSLHQRRFALARREATLAVRAKKVEAARRQKQAMHNLVDSGLRWHLRESMAALKLRRWERALQLFSLFQVEAGATGGEKAKAPSSSGGHACGISDTSGAGGVRGRGGAGGGSAGVATILGLPLPLSVGLWPCMPSSVVASALLLTCRLVHALANELSLAPLPHPVFLPFGSSAAPFANETADNSSSGSSSSSGIGIGGNGDVAAAAEQEGGAGWACEWAAVCTRVEPSVAYLLLPPWGDGGDDEGDFESGEKSIDGDDVNDGGGAGACHHSSADGAGDDGDDTNYESSRGDACLHSKHGHGASRKRVVCGNSRSSSSSLCDHAADPASSGGRRFDDVLRVERGDMASFGTAVALLQTNILNLCIRAEVPPLESRLHPEAVLRNLKALQRHAASEAKKLRREGAAHLPLPAPPQPPPRRLAAAATATTVGAGRGGDGKGGGGGGFGGGKEEHGGGGKEGHGGGGKEGHGGGSSGSATIFGGRDTGGGGGGGVDGSGRSHGRGGASSSSWGGAMSDIFNMKNNNNDNNNTGPVLLPSLSEDVGSQHPISDRMDSFSERVIGEDGGGGGGGGFSAGRGIAWAEDEWEEVGEDLTVPAARDSSQCGADHSCSSGGGSGSGGGGPGQDDGCHGSGWHASANYWIEKWRNGAEDDCHGSSTATTTTIAANKHGVAAPSKSRETADVAAAVAPVASESSVPDSGSNENSTDVLAGLEGLVFSLKNLRGSGLGGLPFS